MGVKETENSWKLSKMVPGYVDNWFCIKKTNPVTIIVVSTFLWYKKLW